uniref:histidine--tRNA ligase n=1 Tax=Acrobeloides nanus TaxID=290746 RepID=A0A914EP07_9BILA
MSSAKELSSEKTALQSQIKELGDQIRVLKTEKANPDVVKEQVAKLQALKAQLGDDFKMVLKTPKGTRDYGPKAMAIREKVLKIITETFKRHGAETIDTPVFELRDVLLGKYGEEGGKLVFDLSDQGGELCSLRYDLTVPFARYVAMNKISNIKRYHIAKVYRRDQPVMTKGRYREFYQCDFDIAGQYDLMLPEAECLKVVDEVLNSLNLGEFYTKLNHRLLLEGIFSICGIKQSDFKTVCSSVDKLDKAPWLEVRAELVNDKHIDEKAVDALEYYVRLRENNASLGSVELLDLLLEDEKAGSNKQIKQAVDELKILFEYLEIYGVSTRVLFDPSLARGLDYYTGAIYETVMKDFSFNAFTNTDSTNPEDHVTVGSVAAGGRYDKLVGMFLESAGKKKADDVPCVGISFGIERLFSIMEMKEESEKSAGRTNETEVYVASAQKGLLKERMKLCRILWDAGIKSEFAYKANPKMLNQLQYCEDRVIPWVVIVGERELKEGVVKLRNVVSREETDIPYDEIVNELQNRLS